MHSSDVNRGANPICGNVQILRKFKRLHQILRLLRYDELEKGTRWIFRYLGQGTAKSVIARKLACLNLYHLIAFSQSIWAIKQRL